jgi:hypothetical protein
MTRSKVKDHGFIMGPEHVNYSDMSQVGTLTIRRNEQGEIEVYTENFEFESAVSCRQASAKAIAWARDVLDTALKADMLVPGGLSSMSCGCD